MPRGLPLRVYKILNMVYSYKARKISCGFNHTAAVMSNIYCL